MEKAQRRPGLPVTGAYHILRHTSCSHLPMQGVTAKAIQELAGHQDLGTTQRCIHLPPAHKDAAIRLLDPRLTGGSVGDGLETGSEPEAKSREVP
jgi:site-specific recombinase XerD